MSVAAIYFSPPGSPRLSAGRQIYDHGPFRGLDTASSSSEMSQAFLVDFLGQVVSGQVRIACVAMPRTSAVTWL